MFGWKCLEDSGLNRLNVQSFVLQVYYCKEDEVCLYQSVAFDVTFREEEPESTEAVVKLSYNVTPRVPSGTSQLILSK